MNEHTIERILADLPNGTTVLTTRKDLGSDAIITSAIALDVDVDENDTIIYTVSDDRDSETLTEPAAALETFADYIETYADNQPAGIAEFYRATIAEARADAARINA